MRETRAPSAVIRLGSAWIRGSILPRCFGRAARIVWRDEISEVRCNLPELAGEKTNLIRLTLPRRALLGKVHSARRVAPVRFTFDCGRSALHDQSQREGRRTARRGRSEACARRSSSGRRSAPCSHTCQTVLDGACDTSEWWQLSIE